MNARPGREEYRLACVHPPPETFFLLRENRNNLSNQGSPVSVKNSLFQIPCMCLIPEYRVHTWGYLKPRNQLMQKRTATSFWIQRVQ